MPVKSKEMVPRRQDSTEARSNPGPDYNSLPQSSDCFFFFFFFSKRKVYSDCFYQKSLEFPTVAIRLKLWWPGRAMPPEQSDPRTAVPPAQPVGVLDYLGLAKHLRPGTLCRVACILSMGMLVGRVDGRACTGIALRSSVIQLTQWGLYYS